MRAMVIRLVAILAAMLVGIGTAAAQDPAQSAAAPGQPGFHAFIQDVRRDALNQGITSATLDRAFANVAYVPHVIELADNSPKARSPSRNTSTAWCRRLDANAAAKY